MSLAQRFARLRDYLWDNPSAEHDARSILSSGKVGLWLGLEVFLIGTLTSVQAFAAQGDTGVRDVALAVGSGPLLIGLTQLILAAFLTLIVPLRASGLMEGPRWRGYLDQLVTTGLTPLRYFAGKWATSQPFLLALLAASLPFVVLFGLLSGADWGRVALGYVLLYAYGNLLLVVAFALGALVHEVAALLLTYLLAGAAVILECIPTPSSLAAFTPVRFLIQPFVEPLGGSQAAILGALYGDPRLFGLELPWPVWAGVIWLGLAGLAGLTCLLGPVHSFLPGLNNFGAVVLPGDGKRFSFRRFRPFLERRVDLAFLFENRGPRWVRASPALGALRGVLAAGGLATLCHAALFDPVVLRRMLRLDEVLPAYGALLSIVLGLALFLAATGRLHAMQRLRLGRLSVGQTTLDLGAFLLVLGWLVGLHVLSFNLAWEGLSLARVRANDPLMPEDLFLQATTLLAVMAAVALSTFCVLKLAGNQLLSRWVVLLCGALYLAALAFLPLLPAGLGQSLLQTDEPALQRFAAPLFVLGQASPLVPVHAVLEGVPQGLRRVSWLVDRGFWLWHGLWLLYLGATLAVSTHALNRERELLAGGDAEARVDPPCASCGSRLAAPVGLTWWGGVLAGRLLGVVRCLECRTDYDRRTGRKNHRLEFLVLAVRCLGWGLVIAAGWVALLWGTQP